MAALAEVGRVALVAVSQPHFSRMTPRGDPRGLKTLSMSVIS
jgi:hypothetical protein